MRTREEIFKFVDELAILWLAYPNLSIMQLITKTHHKDGVKVHEDDVVMYNMDQSYKSHLKCVRLLQNEYIKRKYR
jgi:hypothetical protein